MATPYKIHALHVADKIKLKDVRDRFSGEVIEFSNYELVVRFSENSYLFLYNYGSIVFFNVSESDQEKELLRIQEFVRGATENYRTSDAFLLELQDSASAPMGTKVFFDRVVVSQLSYQVIKISCMLLGESTALEFYEVQIENLLERTNVYSKKLQAQGRMLESSEDLIKFIGLCLDTKQEIISNLYIVDSPDETWESPELDKAHQELKVMLEIDIRYRALEYKIKIIQESIEVIVEMLKSRRETILEMVIIILIVFEIVLSIVQWK